MSRALCVAGLLAMLVGGDASPPVRQRVTPLFVRSQWNTWFRASGIWKAREAIPPSSSLDAVDINCYKNLKICVEATAQLTSDSLAARTELYDIEMWDEKQIRTARAAEPCGYFFITIDRDPPKVMPTRSMIKRAIRSAPRRALWKRSS